MGGGLIKMKSLFISQRDRVLPHHPTQLAAALNAKMINYLQLNYTYAESMNLKRQLADAILPYK